MAAKNNSIYDVFLDGEYIGDYTTEEIEEKFGYDKKKLYSHLRNPRLQGLSFEKVDTCLCKSHAIYRQWNKFIKNLKKSRKGCIK